MPNLLINLFIVFIYKVLKYFLFRRRQAGAGGFGDDLHGVDCRCFRRMLNRSARRQGGHNAGVQQCRHENGPCKRETPPLPTGSPHRLPAARHDPARQEDPPPCRSFFNQLSVCSQRFNNLALPNQLRPSQKGSSLWAVFHGAVPRCRLELPGGRGPNNIDNCLRIG